MIWILIVPGCILGLLGVAIIAGMLLPRDHLARMTLSVNAPADRVWALVSDVAGTARWRADIQKVEVQSAPGEPVRFVETSKQGAIPFVVVSQEAPRRQVVRVVDEGLPFGGIWTWEIQPEGTGTRLTIEEAGFIRNPLFRVMAKLFFPPTATMSTYLRALAKELGEKAEPQ